MVVKCLGRNPRNPVDPAVSLPSTAPASAQPCTWSLTQPLPGPAICFLSILIARSLAPPRHDYSFSSHEHSCPHDFLSSCCPSHRERPNPPSFHLQSLSSFLLPLEQTTSMALRPQVPELALANLFCLFPLSSLLPFIPQRSLGMPHPDPLGSGRYCLLCTISFLLALLIPAQPSHLGMTPWTTLVSPK